MSGLPRGALRAGLVLPVLAASVFLAVLVIGLALPVIPLFVHGRLGYGNVVVGAMVGVQFLATVLTRPRAGRLADGRGSASTMRQGMVTCGLSGLALLAVAALQGPPLVRLLILLAGRLLLGAGESQLIVGALSLGIGLLGQRASGRVLAWVGMAMYGALGAGAPLGLLLDRGGGLALVGVTTLACALAALAIGAVLPAVAPPGGARPSFLGIIGSIWRPGLGVALQGVGFAAIGAFVTLDFQSHGWRGGGLALTGFGAAFVLVRILFGRMPDRFGGYPVAIVSLAVEAAGQSILFLAPDAGIALLGAAVTGMGCSMVFPALGVEVVRLVPAGSRGTALGGFAAFQDIAYGTTGPAAGVIAAGFGYPAAFALGAGAALAGLTTTSLLLMRTSPSRETPEESGSGAAGPGGSRAEPLA